MHLKVIDTFCNYHNYESIPAHYCGTGVNWLYEHYILDIYHNKESGLTIYKGPSGCSLSLEIPFAWKDLSATR